MIDRSAVQKQTDLKAPDSRCEDKRNRKIKNRKWFPFFRCSETSRKSAMLVQDVCQHAVVSDCLCKQHRRVVKAVSRGWEAGGAVSHLAPPVGVFAQGLGPPWKPRTPVLHLCEGERERSVADHFPDSQPQHKLFEP